jgi:hypothetical protein
VKSASSKKSKQKAVSFQMLSPTEIGVHKLKNDDAIAVFKSTPQNKYGMCFLLDACSSPSLAVDTDMWTFPLSSYSQIVEKLKAKEVAVKEIPKEVIAVFKKLDSEEEIDFSGIPPALFSYLLPFQVRGVS